MHWLAITLFFIMPNNRKLSCVEIEDLPTYLKQLSYIFKWRIVLSYIDTCHCCKSAQIMKVYKLINKNVENFKYRNKPCMFLRQIYLIIPCSSVAFWLGFYYNYKPIVLCEYILHDPPLTAPTFCIVTASLIYQAKDIEWNHAHNFFLVNTFLNIHAT